MNLTPNDCLGHHLMLLLHENFSPVICYSFVYVLSFAQKSSLYIILLRYGFWQLFPYTCLHVRCTYISVILRYRYCFGYVHVLSLYNDSIFKVMGGIIFVMMSKEDKTLL